MDRGMDTFKNFPKTKLIQTEKVTTTDNGSSASQWDMYDTYLITMEQEALGTKLSYHL